MSRSSHVEGEIDEVRWEEEEVVASFSFESLLLFLLFLFFFTATGCSFDPLLLWQAERFASKLLGLRGEDMLVILL